MKKLLLLSICALATSTHTQDQSLEATSAILSYQLSKAKQYNLQADYAALATTLRKMHQTIFDHTSFSELTSEIAIANIEKCLKYTAKDVVYGYKLTKDICFRRRQITGCLYRLNQELALIEKNKKS